MPLSIIQNIILQYLVVYFFKILTEVFALQVDHQWF